MIEIYNGLDGNFKLKFNQEKKRIIITFENQDSFEAFFFWLEEMQKRINKQI